MVGNIELPHYLKLIKSFYKGLISQFFLLNMNYKLWKMKYKNVTYIGIFAATTSSTFTFNYGKSTEPLAHKKDGQKLVVFHSDHTLSCPLQHWSISRQSLFCIFLLKKEEGWSQSLFCISPLLFLCVLGKLCNSS